ncbi:hypothetical protein B0J11DRAFT_85568 [Dendryphion nanum]|uniref:Uncharacterized protein n=1 Tax=Dendryphion nanum TaxID=256645 RepID=A0A9P9DH76_9PLEO|nr:hypothetical protein B0J11DRAFT_85568 [Dendryphion nanum]
MSSLRSTGSPGLWIILCASAEGVRQESQHRCWYFRSCRFLYTQYINMQPQHSTQLLQVRNCRPESSRVQSLHVSRVCGHYLANCFSQALCHYRTNQLLVPAFYPLNNTHLA